jgi:hypothetical protein
MRPRKGNSTHAMRLPDSRVSMLRVEMRSLDDVEKTFSMVRGGEIPKEIELIPEPCKTSL